MKRNRKIINCRYLGVLGLYANMIVFLFTDYSLWYFFGAIVCIGILVWLMTCREKRSRF